LSVIDKKILILNYYSFDQAVFFFIFVFFCFWYYQWKCVLISFYECSLHKHKKVALYVIFSFIK